jgi:uncharacterized small protein (DUF1192 family)
VKDPETSTTASAPLLRHDLSLNDINSDLTKILGKLVQQTADTCFLTFHRDAARKIYDNAVVGFKRNQHLHASLPATAEIDTTRKENAKAELQIREKELKAKEDAINQTTSETSSAILSLLQLKNSGSGTKPMVGQDEDCEFLKEVKLLKSQIAEVRNDSFMKFTALKTTLTGSQKESAAKEPTSEFAVFRLDTNDKFQNIKKEMMKKDEEITSLKDQLSKSQAESSKHQRESLRNDAKFLDKFNEQAATIKALKDSQLQFMQDMSSLRQNNAEILQDMNQLLESVASKDQMIVGLQSEIAGLKADNEAHKNIRKQWEMELLVSITELEDSIKQITDRVLAVEARPVAITEHDSLIEELSSRTEVLEARPMAVTEHDSLIKELSSKAQILEAQLVAIAEYKGLIKELSSRVDVLESRLIALPTQPPQAPLNTITWPNMPDSIYQELQAIGPNELLQSLKAPTSFVPIINDLSERVKLLESQQAVYQAAETSWASETLSKIPEDTLEGLRKLDKDFRERERRADKYLQKVLKAFDSQLEVRFGKIESQVSLLQTKPGQVENQDGQQTRKLANDTMACLRTFETTVSSLRRDLDALKSDYATKIEHQSRTLNGVSTEQSSTSTSLTELKEKVEKLATSPSPLQYPNLVDPSQPTIAGILKNIEHIVGRLNIFYEQQEATQIGITSLDHRMNNINTTQLAHQILGQLETVYPNMQRAEQNMATMLLNQQKRDEAFSILHAKVEALHNDRKTNWELAYGKATKDQLNVLSGKINNNQRWALDQITQLQIKVLKLLEMPDKDGGGEFGTLSSQLKRTADEDVNETLQKRIRNDPGPTGGLFVSDDSQSQG